MQLSNGVLIEVESTGEKYHTLKDWKMAMANTDYMGDVSVKTNLIDLPGGDGILDLTEALNKEVRYGSRELKIELGGKQEIRRWDSMFSKCRNAIHGQKVKLIFDSDPCRYYTGRAYVEETVRTREIGTFVIRVEADPFKYDVQTSLEEWKWDIFNFETGVIRKLRDIQINSSNSAVRVLGEEAGVVPVFIVKSITSETMEVTYSGKSYALKIGKNRIPQIRIRKGADQLTFKGTGVVSIEYRGRSL